MMYCSNKELPEIFKGFTYFSGNQWNPGFSWRRKFLQKCTIDKLKNLYNLILEENTQRNKRYNES
jgi:hypothetical protein